jgi:hypothetical protein
MASRPRLLWGPVPILNNKYWSNSLKEIGYISDCVMTNFYSINKKDDFDIYLDEFYIMGRIGRTYFSHLMPFYNFLKSVENYDIFHLPCTGYILAQTFLKRWEPYLLQAAKIKTVVIPYGGDFYRYSRTKSSLLTHALLKSYPAAARIEPKIEENVKRWVKHADIFIPAIQLDGIGRWDILVPSILCYLQVLD